MKTILPETNIVLEKTVLLPDETFTLYFCGLAFLFSIHNRVPLKICNINTSARRTSITLINGTDDSVIVTNTGGTPNTVDIDFGSDTDTWLIYNKDINSPPSPFYRVHFIGTSGWSGHGKTGYVVGDDINEKKTRRLEW